MTTLCWCKWKGCKWKGSPILQFGFHSFLNGISNYKKMSLLPMIVIELAVELDQIFGWSESANGSQRWRWCVDVNEKDLQFGFHSFLHGIPNYKKMSLLPMIVIELAVPKMKMMCWCKWKGSQFRFHSFLNGISNYKKMSLLPVIVIELAGTWPDLWLKWICQWIPKMKMMCWCKWKASPIWIPFIFEWYFKLQKNELVANDCYWIGSGTWPDLWLKWICQWIPKMKMMCWCKWKASPIWIPFIFAWYFKLQSLVEVNLPMDPKDDDIMLIEIKRIYNLDSIHFAWYFKLQKNELVANDCYWIGSGTRPDLWLKRICQWIPKMKMMCWCKWKESPIRIPFIFEWYFKL